MAQMNWIFLDDRGGRHRVGLYHGDRSGHVMIHCNMRVVQIDFSVKETRTYSFFIEDELCELIIERLKDGNFGYEFRVNKTVDTPRNRIRKVQMRQDMKNLWLFIGGVVVVLGVAFFTLRWYGRRQEMERMAISSMLHGVTGSNVHALGEDGQLAYARLQMGMINGQPSVTYSFKTADSTEISSDFPVPDTGQVLLKNGFPLSNGDVFAVYYLPFKPQVHRIELLHPAHSTIETYIKRAFSEEQKMHPELSPEKNLCRVLTMAQSQDWTALADIIFQEKSPGENPVHNRDSYRRLLDVPEVAKAIEEGCRDK